MSFYRGLFVGIAIMTAFYAAIGLVIPSDAPGDTLPVLAIVHA